MQDGTGLCIRRCRNRTLAVGKGGGTKRNCHTQKFLQKGGKGWPSSTHIHQAGSRPGFQRSKFPKSHRGWPQERITSDGRLSLTLKGLSISATCFHGGDCGVVMRSESCFEFHSLWNSMCFYSLWFCKILCILLRSSRRPRKLLIRYALQVSTRQIPPVMMKKALAVWLGPRSGIPKPWRWCQILQIPESSQSLS